jgi:NitT/TauT family transport system permease protein
MKRSVAKVVLPFAAVFGLVLVWHFGVLLSEAPAYLVPTPVQVLAELNAGLVRDGTLWPHIWTTLVEIVSGYVFGCFIGLLFAALISESVVLEWAFYPLISGIQSIPKVALAPILMVWFGFEMESKIILVGLVCFFPTFVNAFAGFRGASGDLIDLYRAFGASRWRIFWSVKMPSAAGAIFSGLEISIVLALIGAVVAELLSSRSGLGHVIAASGANFNVAMMFACSLILACIGMLLTQIVRQARRRLAFWEGRIGAVSASVQ